MAGLNFQPTASYEVSEQLSRGIFSSTGEASLKLFVVLAG
jgi:hypothetical protein